MALFYFLITIAQTWPLALNLGDSLFDLGDPADSVYRIGTIANNLREYPFDFSRLYQTNAFYPVSNGLALDELLTGNAILAAPLIWLTDNPVLAFNLLILAAYTLSGFAMWLLVRKLTGSSLAGLVAGVIYAFSPWHIAQYLHLGIANQGWMILALYFLIGFLETPAKPGRVINWPQIKYLVLFGICFVTQALVAGYHAYLQSLLIGGYLLYHFGWRTQVFNRLLQLVAHLVKRGRNTTIKLDWARVARQVGLLALIGAIILAIIIPFVWPFQQQQARFGFKRELSEVRNWSAAPASLLRTNPQSWVYEPLQKNILKSNTGSERALYPGLSVVILAVLGLAMARKLKTKFTGARWYFGLVALGGLLLCFGPYLNLREFGKQRTDISLPYLWLYQNLPGFDSLRVPLRFGQLWMLGLAVCVGYGVAWLASRPWKSKSADSTRRKGFYFGLAALLIVLAELYAPSFSGELVKVGVGSSAPPLYRWLASNPEAARLVRPDALLVELPLPAKQPTNTRPDYLVQALYHKRPLLNGSANILPSGYESLLNEVDDFPLRRTLTTLEGLQVQFVIVHRDALLPRFQNELDKSLNAGSDMELVYQVGNDLLVRIKPDTSLAEARRFIAKGATVFLGEFSRYQSLYLHSLAGTLGQDYNFVAPSRNVYSDALGIKPGRVENAYEYAFFYRNVDPTKYGYRSDQRVWENEVAALYYKPNITGAAP